MPGPNFATPYTLSIGYTFDTPNPNDVAAAHRLESDAADAYQRCAQAPGADQGPLRDCEIAYRKAIASIPHAQFVVEIGGGRGQLVPRKLAAVPVTLATSRDFDPYLTHLEANDRFAPMGLVAYPSGHCDVRLATSGAPSAARTPLCVALDAYFADQLRVALEHHSDAAFTLLADGVRLDRSPYDVALGFEGMTAAFVRRLQAAGFPVDARDAGGLTPLQRYLEHQPDPRSVDALLDAGAHVDQHTLLLAAQAGNAFVMQELVRHAANLPRSAEVLRGAILSGTGDVVAALLDAGWSANAPIGRVPLLEGGSHACGAACAPLELALAAGVDRAAMTATLLAHGADPNAHQGAPLWLAVQSCDGPAVLKALFEHGARRDERLTTRPECSRRAQKGR
jgi:hypothetical protein